MTAAPRALSLPVFDALAAGGASLAAFAAFSLVGAEEAGPLMLTWFVPLSLALNWPHFMASYHVLYTTPGAVRRYPAAAVVVPILLAAYALAAAAFETRWPWMLRAFHAAAGVYLAWHYAGQTWGTMAAFAHVEGIRVEKAARGLIRANLSVLLAWHALWAARAASPLVAGFDAAYQALSAAALLSAALGAAGLFLLARAAGRLPARVVLPWLALHVGYAFLYRFPGQGYWMQIVQLSHALQYLSFPLRVQTNRDAQAGLRPAPWRPAAYYLALAAGGLGAFYALPRAADGLFGTGTGQAGMAVLDALVIHHYFVDGVIWRLGDPDVRRDLFAHLGPH
ncbi:MAG: hypothetical protein M0D55_00865 [Elusimicrobiota bacterium]|nr:MAG: hypothetical protein M0D55_00865 [Elusimicrobiota bacterium]